MMRPLILIAAAAALVPAVADASSFDRDVQVRVVRVSDLDIASSEGMDRTIRRLRGTIDGMCESDEDCRDEAWRSADWQVARNLAAAQWRRRVADERFADRARFHWRDDGPIPDEDWGAPPPPPPPPPPPVEKVTTTTTTVTTTTTTVVTIAYRDLPPDYGWYPH